MASRLTTFSKFLITLFIMGLIGVGLYFLLNGTAIGDQVKEKAENITGKNETTGSSGVTSGNNNSSTSNTGANKVKNSGNDDDVLKVQVFTWGGYAPGLYFNEGAQWSERSRFYKDYGLKVEFVLIDDFEASRKAFEVDEVNLLGQETGAMNTEMERLAKYDPRVFIQVDWSRGGDAVVVGRGIKTVNDLKGKKIAYGGYSPSVSFLAHMLESAGMDFNDVERIEVASAPDAANAFKSGKVDAAIVWSPDDLACVRAVPGSKVLQSTVDASNIIADVFMVKNEYVKNNSDKLAAFYEGWMKGAAEINSNKNNYKKAAKIMSELTGLPQADAEGMMSTVRLTTHGDNLDFFGQNVNFKGVTGESLYTKMGENFVKINQAPKSRPQWRAISYAGAVQKANLSGPAHKSEGQKNFKAPTAADKTAPAISSKPISISFATGKFELGENAKTIIDLQFADVAKSYKNTRIRVEGNTDSVGNLDMNKKLSEKRARSVADYLQKQYNMSPNRFIIVGNGPSKPVKGCEQNQNEACKAKNRRTEFQLVAG